MPPRPPTLAPGAVESAPAARTWAVVCELPTPAAAPAPPTRPGSRPPRPAAGRRPLLPASPLPPISCSTSHTLSPSCLGRSFLPVLRAPSSQLSSSSWRFLPTRVCLFPAWVPCCLAAARRDSFLGRAARCLLRNRNKDDNPSPRSTGGETGVDFLSGSRCWKCRWLNTWKPSIFV